MFLMPQEWRIISNFFQEKTKQWSLMSIFLVCLLACTITTVIGVLIVSLVYVNNPQPHSEPGAQSLLAWKQLQRQDIWKRTPWLQETESWNWVSVTALVSY